MDVFPKYFRRLVVGNSPQIFPGINKAVENPGNYPLLVGELRKIPLDPEQARRMADSIDTADGDLFKNFDLATFIDHFNLNPVDKSLLALAFTTAARPDLSTKADAILSANFPHLLEYLASQTSTGTDGAADLPVPVVARVIEGLAQHSPMLNEDGKAQLVQAITMRYLETPGGVPLDVSMPLQLIDLLKPPEGLARALLRGGPQSTATVQACRDLLQTVDNNTDIDDDLIAGALLFMLATPKWRQYNPANLVTAVRERSDMSNVSWPQVVRHFDREGLLLDSDRFLVLYDALLPVALDDSRFDLQLLWAGKWQHPETQLSFLTAFIRADPDALNVASIPRLRTAFTLADFDDAAEEEVRERAAQIVTTPLVSLDATMALFDLILLDAESLASAVNRQQFPEMLQTNVDAFVCAAMKVPKPWTNTQQEVITRLFMPFLFKEQRLFSLVLHCAWKRDKQWVATRLVEVHAQDPMKLPLLLDHAQTHRWLRDLLMLLNGLGLDLAALAHRRDILDINQWARTNADRAPEEFANVIARFLTIKADDELKTARGEQSTQRTISLAVRTVKALSQILEQILPEERVDELASVQRLTVQVYPRLINYGQGFDDIIDVNDEQSKAFPADVEELMGEHLKAMYRNERDVADIVDALRTYKDSRDPATQDLFACMIHALYDEYSCFHGYELEPLAMTAVLFGAIIKFGLVSGVPLRVALGMVLEALRDFQPDTFMFKFGLQALLHFTDRLHEWPPYASCLLQIPGLEGTEAYRAAQDATPRASEHLNGDAGDCLTDPNGLTDGVASTNGNPSELPRPGSSRPPFESLHVEPSDRTDFEDPSEEAQDSILFTLNNLSEQNLEPKTHDLMESLQEEHHDWLAGYLVEERARMQPNFHKLYIDMLATIGSKPLWAEVLRRTFVSVIRMLNAQSTLESSVERTYLKNLAGWLGSLTLARNKPIKYKNISFKDLLIEAYDTERLITVIPFTCRVLAQAGRSIVFKPPNPWLMDTIGLLIELYHFAELRLQLKFEIEVVCQDLGLDHRNIEPSFTLRGRPQQEEELSGPSLPVGPDTFDELAYAVVGRPNGRGHRFSPSSITASLPDFRSMLVYPPTSNTSINRDTLRYIVENAVRRAIVEIITPVVERSVGIATIATAQLIQKDFSMEPDEDRVRQASLTMVKALAGSLALVTCKEPLRMSMTNNIRVLSAEVDEQALPEGAILMCVNDNLDAACSLVEGAAEIRAMPEIEENIEDLIEARRRHRLSGATAPFMDAVVSRWAFYIPEPYRQSQHGLNVQQMAIYDAFSRQSRSTSSHEQSSSTDSGRLITNDVLQDLPSDPNLSTPIDTPAMIYDNRPPQPQHVQPPPPSMVPQVTDAPRLNGYPQPKSVTEQIQECLFELQRATREITTIHLTQLPPNNPISEIHHQTIRLIAMSPHRDQVALATARRLYDALYTQTEKVLEVEVLVHLLKDLCDLVAVASRELTLWLAKQEDEPVFSVQVIVTLLESDLLDLHRVDVMTSKALYQHNPDALEFLTEMLDQLLFSDEPAALRADFVASIEAVLQWLMQEPTLALAEQLVQKLRERGGRPEVSEHVHDRQSAALRRHIEYMLTEWTRLCSRTNVPDKAFVAFISQIHEQDLLKDEDSSCLFFRIGIEMAVRKFEKAMEDPTTQLGDAFAPTDALAKLVVSLLKYNESDSRQEKPSRAAYLDSILSLLVLVLNHHHGVHGESFSQRVFFRLFSTFLCEYQPLQRQLADEDRDPMLVVAKTFMALQPLHFPGFAFGWLSLISHRFFLPDMLLMSDQAGWEPYTIIVSTMLSYVGDLLKSFTVSNTTRALYKGALRILLMLHHDFPEFLAENHHQLCGAIPVHCTQLRNLILSAYPSSFPELPDPFTVGLKVDRINEIRTSPVVAGNYQDPIRNANLIDLIDSALEGKQMDEHISIIAEHISHPLKNETGINHAPVHVDINLVNALVLYVGMHALTVTGENGGPTFVQDSPEGGFFVQLAQRLPAEARYHLISAIANQLRYPNSHTHYFSYALLYLFGSEPSDQPEVTIRQQITRVLLERLIVHRPHPWGLIITLLELLKNSRYSFWDLPFIKAAPEIERLFGVLFQHINQSPRS